MSGDETPTLFNMQAPPGWGLAGQERPREHLLQVLVDLEKGA